MSHHNSIQNHQPTKVIFEKSNNSNDDLKSRGIPVPVENKALLISGQGTLVFTISNKQSEPNESVTFETASGEELILNMNKDVAAFYYRKGSSEKWSGFELENHDTAIIKPNDDYSLGIDANDKCQYWISIDSLNKRLRYGKGEMRLSTTLLDYQYDIARNLFDKDKDEKYPLVDNLKTIKFSAGINPVSLWKDPIVVEPAALVVAPSDFTMDDAATGMKTTPTSLSKECQILYGNVADFQLNTPDFPDFEQAIEHSIRTKGCVGYKILEYKLKHNEFNAGDKPSDYKEIYLRITLGQSQGESPGIPYVMEIWPVGCASPVHHHGFTHAIIKVLRGDIDVDIFRMLPSKGGSKKPLKTVTFNPNDVTYLMPEANQFHLLKNNLKNTKTCITIQCYAYSQEDKEHYATFDYIEDDKLGHFDPISDYDYLEFKAKVKEEWNDYLQKRFWLDKKV